MVSLPLVGSQCCPTRACNKSFQSFDDKTTLSKSFDSSFSQSNVGTFSHVSTSCGLSKRRISAVFSCFDQSLILLAASITRSQTILPLFTPPACKIAQTRLQRFSNCDSIVPQVTNNNQPYCPQASAPSIEFEHENVRFFYKGKMVHIKKIK